MPDFQDSTLSSACRSIHSLHTIHHILQQTLDKMSVQVTPAQMDTLKSTLLNTTGSTPLHERFRALFMLKAVNNDQVVKIVAEGKSTTLADQRPLTFTSTDIQDSRTHPHYSNTNQPMSQVNSKTPWQSPSSKTSWSTRLGNTVQWSDTKLLKLWEHYRARAAWRS